MISDAYNHAFSESIHLSTIHAKYGSNHLESTLAKAGADNDNNKNQKGLRADQPFLVHLNWEQPFYDFSIDKLNNHYSLFKLFRLPSTLLGKFAPPPRFYDY